MGEQIYIDLFGEEVVLSDESRAKILNKRPTAAQYLDWIGIALREPDEIRRSVSDDRQVLYYRFEDEVLGGKWIVVVVKQVDRNFISTVYPSHRMKKGEVLWKRR